MLTAHAALSPALPLPLPEKVADVDENAVSTPETANVVEDGARTPDLVCLPFHLARSAVGWMIVRRGGRAHVARDTAADVTQR